MPNPDAAIPAALDWPGYEQVGDLQAEIFKIRDRNNTVVGIGSRLASAEEPTGMFIEWALHFPARGTMYIKMEVTPSADGFRNGIVVSGTRDFGMLSGSVREQFIANVENNDEVQSRIRLEALLVGPLGEES